MKTETIKLSELYSGPCQPKTRATKSNTAELLESLETEGQLIPASVYLDPDWGDRMVIAAGHRRKFCLELLGKETMDCVVIPKAEAARHFKATNIARPLQPKESQGMYRENSEFLTKTQIKYIKHAIKIIGDSLFDRIVEDDRIAAVALAREIRDARSAIATVDADFVANRFTSQELASATYAMGGYKPLLDIRLSSEPDIRKKGRRYMQTLKPFLPKYRRASK